MIENDWEQAVSRIRDLVLAGDTIGIGDSLLLKLFVSEQSEAAFEAIVRRHGPMVVGVCRRTLSNSSDVEDAFQATFLILVRKAATLTHPELLANWLYGVAYRTACTARHAALRRRAKESQVTRREVQSDSSDLHDLLPVLDEELNRLPSKYRRPIVLCDLELKSRKEVSAALGLLEGTLASRLARARSLLARRLARRGVALTGFALGEVLARSVDAASPALVQATVKAGVALFTGQAGTVKLASTAAFRLHEMVMRTLYLNKLKVVGVLLVSGMLLSTGAGTLIAQNGKTGAVNPVVEVVDDQNTKTNSKLTVAGLLELALEAISGVPDSQAKANLLLRIAETQIQAGDRTGALASAKKAMVIVKNWPTAEEKVQKLVQVARLQDRAGQMPTSRTTGQEALHASLEDSRKSLIGRQHPGSATLNRSVQEVVRLLSSWGEYAECLRIATEYKPRATALDRRMATVPERDEWEALVVGCMALEMDRHNKGSELAARQALKQASELIERQIRAAPEQIHASSSGPGPRALEAIASAYICIGDLQGALKTSNMMETLPWGKFSAKKPNALHSIAFAQERADDFQGALETISKPNFSKQAEGFRSSTLGRIAERQIEKGDLANALKTTGELINAQQKANMLLAIARAELRKGDRASALARLSEIRKLNEPVAEKDKRDGGIWRLNAPSIAVVQIDLQARLGDFESALQGASKLKDSHDKIEAMSFIGAQFIAAKRLGEARETLRRASELAQSVQTPPAAVNRRGRVSSVPRNPRFQNFSPQRIAQLQAKAGDAEGALQTEKLLAAENYRSWLVVARAEGGDIKGAVEWLTMLSDQGDKSIALEKLARIMTKAGDEAGAIALAEKLESPISRAYSLLGIAMEKANPGERSRGELDD